MCSLALASHAQSKVLPQHLRHHAHPTVDTTGDGGRGEETLTEAVAGAEPDTAPDARADAGAIDDADEAAIAELMAEGEDPPAKPTTAGDSVGDNHDSHTAAANVETGEALEEGGAPKATEGGAAGEPEECEVLEEGEVPEGPQGAAAVQSEPLEEGEVAPGAGAGTGAGVGRAAAAEELEEGEVADVEDGEVRESGAVDTGGLLTGAGAEAGSVGGGGLQLGWLGGGGASSPPPPPVVDPGPPAENVRFAKVEVPSPYASSRVRDYGSIPHTALCMARMLCVQLLPLALCHSDHPLPRPSLSTTTSTHTHTTTKTHSLVYSPLTHVQSAFVCSMHLW